MLARWDIPNAVYPVENYEDIRRDCEAHGLHQEQVCLKCARECAGAWNVHLLAMHGMYIGIEGLFDSL